MAKRGATVATYCGCHAMTDNAPTATITASPAQDAITTAVFYARCLSITLDHVPLQQQARIDMQDLLDVMIQQIRGEL